MHKGDYQHFGLIALKTKHKIVKQIISKISLTFQNDEREIGREETGREGTTFVSHWRLLMIMANRSLLHEGGRRQAKPSQAKQLTNPMETR